MYRLQKNAWTSVRSDPHLPATSEQSGAKGPRWVRDRQLYMACSLPSHSGICVNPNSYLDLQVLVLWKFKTTDRKYRTLRREDMVSLLAPNAKQRKASTRY